MEEILNFYHEIILSGEVEGRRQNAADLRRTVSNRTIVNFVNSFDDVVEVSTEVTSEASYRETRDPRNLFSWAALCFSYIEDIYPQLAFNWDATVLSFGNFILDVPKEILISKYTLDNLKGAKTPLKSKLDRGPDNSSSFRVFVKKYF